MLLLMLSSLTVRLFAYTLSRWGPYSFIAVPLTVANMALPKVAGDISSVELSAVKVSADITVGLYASIQQAIAGFRSLPADDSVPKTFIFTGNKLPFVPRDAPWSSMISLGLQKIDGAYLIESFYSAYEKEGFRYAFPSFN